MKEEEARWRGNEEGRRRGERREERGGLSPSADKREKWMNPIGRLQPLISAPS